MKFKKEHGVIIGFVATLLVPFVAGIVVKNSNEDEKKQLSEFPTALTNAYFQEINDWYSDHALFRTGMINIFNTISDTMETQFRNWLISLDIKYHTHNHIHEFGEWEIIKEATEEESGLRVKICKICGEKVEEVIPQIPHVHTFSDVWEHDENEHWHPATCTHTSVRKDSDLHQYGEVLYDEDGNPYRICQVCNFVSFAPITDVHVHSFSSGWKSDDTHHWNYATCEHTDLRIHYEEHTFGDYHVYDEANGLKAKTCEICDYDHIVDISNQLETKIDIDDRPYYSYVEASKDVLYGRDNWLFYLGNNSLGYFKGTNVLNDENLKKNVAKLQKLKDACDEKGLTVIFAMLPNKDQVYPEYMPTVEGKLNTLKRAQLINNYIQFNTELNYTYPLTVLSEGKSDCPTYYMQDSHWNEYGGLLAAKEMFKKTGWEFKNYDINLVDKTGGDLTSMAALPASTYKEPKINYYSEVGLEYSYTSTYLDQLSSSNKNGKNLLLVGDSFRYSLLPYFAKEVENTLSSHRSQIAKDMFKNYVSTLKAGDIVLYTFVERLDTDGYNKAEDLASLIANI